MGGLPISFEVNRGFDPGLEKAKTMICFFSAKHAVVRFKRKDRLALSRENACLLPQFCSFSELA